MHAPHAFWVASEPEMVVRREQAQSWHETFQSRSSTRVGGSNEEEWPSSPPQQREETSSQIHRGVGNSEQLRNAEMDQSYSNQCITVDGKAKCLKRQDYTALGQRQLEEARHLGRRSSGHSVFHIHHPQDGPRVKLKQVRWEVRHHTNSSALEFP